MNFGSALEQVHRRAPLVDCITNFVTVNDCANILLAVGGSPTMASDIREVQETAAAASALLCNLGAIDKVESMILGGQAANRAGKPVVFDPVGAGNTSLRRAESARLLDAVQFAVIRGNASEIRALAQRRAAGSGVDVSDADQITEKTLPRTVASARALAVQTGAVVAVSGPIDVLTDGRETILLHNGCATMSRVTGSGCMLTALMGAFCGAMPGQPFAAACAAAATMGVAGELAEARRLAHGTGNATFRTDLIDAVFNLTPAQLDLYAVTNGPGSFTGLRIGLAAVKGLAFAANTPCAGVSTMAALAYGVCGEGTVIGAQDARRGQVYWAGFDLATHARLTPDAAEPVTALETFVKECKKPLIFVGDGAALCYNTYKDQPGILPCPQPLRVLRGAGVALVGKAMWDAGTCVSPAELLPDYHRLSQAERERAEREAAQQSATN